MNFETEFTGSNTQITATDGGKITSEHPLLIIVLCDQKNAVFMQAV